MFYPLKFDAIYKDYLWGGRNLEKYKKNLPEGIVAESWEIACHPDGVSVISNGAFKGISLLELIEKHRRGILGDALLRKNINKFPLLVKLIDANDWLSVQVHPNDSYAQVHESSEFGKYEMWYVLSAKPGAKLIYGILPGVTREVFTQAIKGNYIDRCLNYIEVFPGDILSIPAGFIHSTGPDIVVAEIQQNSNITYRIYDFDRVDKFGNKRPLDIEKALEVIEFNADKYKKKTTDLIVNIGDFSSKTYKIANKYFAVELYKIHGEVNELANGSRFYIYLCIEGKGEILYEGGSIKVYSGDTFFIPASMGKYTLKGEFCAIKSYVPDFEENIISPLKRAGYSEAEIYEFIEEFK
ncbi:MAG: type I phosphomannose isomerase catalytic subunit [Clostridium sp.]|uniref:type I phosphomannose isomerase catalytic subunit n=1 Tax=Clostridium sp. TaxID=1506 RepID=UPI00302E46A7